MIRWDGSPEPYQWVSNRTWLVLGGHSVVAVAIAFILFDVLLFPEWWLSRASRLPGLLGTGNISSGDRTRRTTPTVGSNARTAVSVTHAPFAGTGAQ
jgi:hypothetical protein